MPTGQNVHPRSTPTDPSLLVPPSVSINHRFPLCLEGTLSLLKPCPVEERAPRMARGRSAQRRHHTIRARTVSTLRVSVSLSSLSQSSISSVLSCPLLHTGRRCAVEPTALRPELSLSLQDASVFDSSCFLARLCRECAARFAWSHALSVNPCSVPVT